MPADKAITSKHEILLVLIPIKKLLNYIVLHNFCFDKMFDIFVTPFLSLNLFTQIFFVTYFFRSIMQITSCMLVFHHSSVICQLILSAFLLSKINIETNLKIANFLDMTFNLINGSYNPYKNPNDTLLYINKNSNHPPQIIKKLPKTINDRLCRNSSNAEIFHASKIEYQTALRNSGYGNLDFKYNLVHKNNSKQSRQRNIIWFNPPFSQAVSTNITKRFLDLLDKCFSQK